MVHLKKHVQIVILIVNGRVTQFFVIVPADDITAGGRHVVVSDTVIPDFDRKEIISTLLVPELFKHFICQPRIPLKEIRCIFLQVRGGI